MSRPARFQFLYNSNPMLTLIDGTVLVGAAGAVTSSSGNLVESVTHVSTGIYKFNLRTNLNAFLGFSASMIETSGPANAVASISSKSTSPTDLTDGSTPSFTVHCRDYAGSLVDPANGQILTLQVMGRNSSVSQ